MRPSHPCAEGAWLESGRPAPNGLHLQEPSPGNGTQALDQQSINSHNIPRLLQMKSGTSVQLVDLFKHSFVPVFRSLGILEEKHKQGVKTMKT